MNLPPEIALLLQAWNKWAIVYMASGIGLLTAGVLASLAVTAFADTLDTKWIRALGFLAAACTALLTALNPIGAGFHFRAAWRVLHKATLEYSLAPAADPKKLLAAVDEGEAIIGQFHTGNFNEILTKETEAGTSNLAH